MSPSSRVATLLFVALGLVACGKKKAPDDKGDKGDKAASASGSAAAKSAAAASGDDGKTTGPSAPAKETTSCTLPAQGMIKTDWTLTRGCALDVPDHIVITEGATLTISPGVKLAFGSGAYLEVRNGKLLAQGSEDAPIVMTSRSKSPSKGDWGGILFRDRPAAGNVLDHVVIEYAGKPTYVGPGIIRQDSDGALVSITHTTVQHSTGDIVELTTPGGSFAKLEHDTFKDNDGNAMHVPADALGTIGVGNVLGAPVHVFGDATKNATWPAIDSFYVIEGKIELGTPQDNVTLTLPEGATLEFNGDGMFAIGGHGGGGIIAKGVTFTSSNATPSPGDWSGVVFFGKTTATNLDGCTFAYAGKKTLWGVGVLDFHDGKPADYPGFKLTHTTFAHDVGPAVRADKGDCGDLATPAAGNTIDTGTLCAKDAT